MLVTPVTNNMLDFYQWYNESECSERLYYIKGTMQAMSIASNAPVEIGMALEFPQNHHVLYLELFVGGAKMQVNKENN